MRVRDNIGQKLLLLLLKDNGDVSYHIPVPRSLRLRDPPYRFLQEFNKTRNPFIDLPLFVFVII